MKMSSPENFIVDERRPTTSFPPSSQSHVRTATHVHDCQARKFVLVLFSFADIKIFSINLLVVYRESVNLIGYITRRLSADSLQF